MNRENLNSKPWYRAIKVLFVVAFITIEAVSLIMVHKYVSQKRSFTLAEVLYSGAIPEVVFQPLTQEQYQKAIDAGFTPDEIIKFEKKRKTDSELNTNDNEVPQSDVVKQILNGPRLILAVGHTTPITISDFQIIKSNIEKMIRAGVKNQGINSYTDFALSQIDNGTNLQVLPDKPTSFDKYSLTQKIADYAGTFAVIFIFFWLISRVFFYIALGENFLPFRTKK